MTFSLRRATVLATLTAVALGGLTGVGFASDTGRTATSLSIRLARLSINPGQHDAVSGQLRTRRHPVAGKTVELQSRLPNAPAWSDGPAATTGDRGGVRFVVAPTATTRYRLVFHGTQRLRPTLSGVVTVIVRKPTAMTIALTQNSPTVGSDVVAGTLSSGGNPLDAKTVHLLKRTDSDAHFSSVATASTAADGSVSFTVTPTRTTHYRLAFRGNRRYSGSRSGVVTVHVQSSSSLSIRAAASDIVSGDTDVISGELRGNGHALGGRTITLMERPTGGATWTAVGSEKANANGHVAFTETPPTGSDDYQLVFAGGPNYAGCHSGVVTVTVS